MITKTGMGLIDLVGMAGSGALGAYRANELNSEEADALKAKYDLDDDANLSIRNAGRGIFYGGLGALGGGMLTAPAL